MTQPDGAVTLDLGYAETGRIEKAFTGSWRVEAKPIWLTLKSQSGVAGQPLVMELRADRNVGLSPEAAQPQLSSVIRVRWQPPGSSVSTTSVWTVQARRYALSGQVQWPALSGTDAAAAPDDVQPAAAGAGGETVIVKYRSAAVARAVAQAVAQPVDSRPDGNKTGGDTESVPSDLSAAQRQAALESAGRWQQQAGQVAGRLGGQTLVAGAADPQALAALLRRDPAVEYAVVSAPLSSQQAAETGSPSGASPQEALAQPVVPGDEYAPLQWAYRTLGYGGVWRDMEAGGYTRPVTVAVLDSGVRYDHPDLQGQLLTGAEGALDVLGFAPAATGQAAYDNGDGDGADRDPTDPAFAGRTPHSHGTHVSGIIAARWGQQAVGNPKWSTSGVVGASYRAPVRILPVRVIDAAGKTDVAQVVAGIRYAAGQAVTLDGQTFRSPAPVQVMNLSLGGQISAAEAQPMCDAVAEARAAGVLVVAAAGNYYGASQVYPAACPAALAVGSVTLSGGSAPRHSEFSNRFAEVALSAPGGTALGNTYNGGILNEQPAPDQIFSTDWDYAKNEPRYAYQAGTSQAAPQVSALAALLLSKGVTTGPDDTAARLTTTATDLGTPGRDEYFGYGMINPAAALGAPAVSAAPGFSLQSDRGQSYQPPLDAQGRFTAYLGAGNFTLRGGIDRSGNGLAGEYGEAGAQVSGTLSAEQPEVQLAPLVIR
ncbi:peptidase S8 and S53 subtilisin kexin sedolisin [Deinococcus proteolyticus MRP]|uniref:Peptidase S8 and S53 subtilisin kexin sedolisin n=1 Tax=Deinococcus proteolyticus (strain ATCC 35074 / DSM 20540 / JCM 6276 / NBRC 101906 / NCIMB 13154 / VKM Ac-1939 / CCM 2703 / MRP) TaxID=693977 RepID=F0RL25_DEIPM|nr:S8 family serine peptidase [Deinococcus proteolyticus]ADY25798.1 peptidase S8 and S53 subtilisin kexin sedolisin [Deinococcus proteolyticus MRP]